MLPEKLTKIDALTRPSHKFLEPDDRCFFLGEYTAGAGFRTPTNDLIFNFKITSADLAATPGRRWHKDRAVREVAAAVGRHLSKLPPGAIVVPIPTSKLPEHPEYDDRLLGALRGYGATPPLSIRELIKQRKSTQADHESTRRQSYNALLKNCYLDEKLALPKPTGIVLFDDLLTEGKHFKVCKQLLLARYGPVKIDGFFIARRIYKPVEVDFEDLDRFF